MLTSEPVAPAQDAASAAFALEHVSKSYGAVQALQDVNLVFAAGSRTALIGSSGSGKSTVLRLLLGLDWPDQGRVRTDGRALERDQVLALRRRVGDVIQDGG